MRGIMTKLRALRANRGGPRSTNKPLTLRDLSARTGYSIGHLSDVEQGRKPAGDAMIDELARVFRKPVKAMRKISEATFREAARVDS